MQARLRWVLAVDQHHQPQLAPQAFVPHHCRVHGDVWLVREWPDTREARQVLKIDFAVILARAPALPRHARRGVEKVTSRITPQFGDNVLRGRHHRIQIGAFGISAVHHQIFDRGGLGRTLRQDLLRIPGEA